MDGSNEQTALGDHINQFSGIHDSVIVVGDGSEGAAHSLDLAQAFITGDRTGVRGRVDAAEAAREALPLLAVDVVGGRERVVHTLQRIALDRDVEVVYVQSAGVSAARLRQAESLLFAAGYHGRGRSWVAADSRCGVDELVQIIATRAGDPEAAVGLLIHAPDGSEGPTLVQFREMHLGACILAGAPPGPSVMAGTSWRVDRTGVVRLLVRGPAGRESATLDDDLAVAIRENRLTERIAVGNADAISILAALARADERATGRYDDLVSKWLGIASASARRAWSVLMAQAADDPKLWSAERDFIALLVRGQREPVVPLGRLEPTVLAEAALWDEVLRLPPATRIYREVLATPAACAVGLDVGPRPAPDRGESA